MLTTSQIHAAEHDGQSVAYRLLLLLNEHLHPVAYPDITDGTEAATAMLDAFAMVFAGPIAEALEAAPSAFGDVLLHAIVRRAPELLASLNR